MQKSEAQVIGDTNPAARTLDRPMENGGNKRICLPQHKYAAAAKAAKECAHGTYFGGLCVICGAKKEDCKEQSLEKIVASDNLKNLELTPEQAEEYKQKERMELLKQKKLDLILDLDHTLLNTTLLSDLHQEQHQMLDAATREGQQENRRQMLYKFERMGLWTKLRPGVFEFLQELAPLYQLHIYTNAEQAYAKQMAEILDPKKNLFESRIISVQDSTTRLIKDLDVALAVEDSVLIVDDTLSVWPKHKENVLKIERYHYFPSSIRQFNRHGRSLLEQGHDEIADYSALAQIKQILINIHSQFFNSEDFDYLQKQDVRKVLKQVRGQILAGEVLLLSKAFHEFAQDNTVWKVAKELGAECALDFRDDVSVLVSGMLGTEKALWAEKRDIPVVSADWVYASAALWATQEKKRFRLKPPPKPVAP